MAHFARRLAHSRGGMSRRTRAAEGSSVTAFSEDGRSSGGAEWKELMALSPDDLEDALEKAGSALKEGRDLKTSANAVLALQLDDDDSVRDPEQLLHALRIAQVALRGERTRGDAGEKAAAAEGTAGSAGTNAAGMQRKVDEALAEAKRATDDARAAREELKQADDELQDKREEVEELNQTLSELESGGPGGKKRISITSSGDSADRMRNELTERKEEVQELRAKVRDQSKDSARKEEQLDRERQTVEELRTAQREEREERRQVEDELRVMREQVRGYRERLDNTTETVVAREERNREAKKGLREKTREINRLHDERARLMNELKERSEDVDELIQESEATKQEFGEIKSQADERARLVDDLEGQLARAEERESAAKEQLEQMSAELEVEALEQDEMAQQYEASIEELKGEVKARGALVEQQGVRLRELEEKIETVGADRQVTQLRGQLEGAAKELQQKEEALLELRRQVADGSYSAGGGRKSAAVAAAEAQVEEQQRGEARRTTAELARVEKAREEAAGALEAVRAKYASLGEKFTQREDIIVELRARMGEYETGVYGLREAVAETERGKTVIVAREADVTRMTQERNSRESQLQDLREEVVWLRQKAGIKPGEGTGIDLTKLRLKGQVELDQLRAQVMHLEEEVGALEQERLKLKKRLGVQAINRGERAALLEISVEKLTALEEMEVALSRAQP